MIQDLKHIQRRKQCAFKNNRNRGENGLNFVTSWVLVLTSLYRDQAKFVVVNSVPSVGRQRVVSPFFLFAIFAYRLPFPALPLADSKYTLLSQSVQAQALMYGTAYSDLEPSKQVRVTVLCSTSAGLQQ